jgi:hypothetical protein
MKIHGRVQNGVVVLENGIALPEGASVIVSFDGPPGKSPEKKDRIQVPLVRTGQPGSVTLTGKAIAEILNEEDASSRR